MNVLFMSLGSFDDLAAGSVHIDIMKRFAKEHDVYLVCIRERRQKKPTELTKEFGMNVLRVRTGNIKKTNLLEKGISTVLVEPQFKNAIKKYFSDIKFDFVLYTTPPITFANVVKYVKRRDNAKSYLMLKDIFPQNAVDMGMMTQSGVKGIIYKFFRSKEKKLYAMSDYIGCMSPANVDYLCKHNPELDSKKVEICPNSIEITKKDVNEETRKQIRDKYGIPNDKKVFVYGGNLGKPQGISFLINCLESQKNNKEDYFLIIGDGTEYSTLLDFFNRTSATNMKLLKRLPKEDYEALVATCDIGMIFLDYRFTIPNFPSRLLSYMQVGIPVLAATDTSTDVGKIIVDGGFGWWCASNSVEGFSELIEQIKEADSKKAGSNAKKYLINNYSTEQVYSIITSHFV